MCVCNTDLRLAGKTIGYICRPRIITNDCGLRLYIYLYLLVLQMSPAEFIISVHMGIMGTLV